VPLIIGATSETSKESLSPRTRRLLVTEIRRAPAHRRTVFNTHGSPNPRARPKFGTLPWKRSASSSFFRSIDHSVGVYSAASIFLLAVSMMPGPVSNTDIRMRWRVFSSLPRASDTWTKEWTSRLRPPAACSETFSTSSSISRPMAWTKSGPAAVRRGAVANGGSNRNNQGRTTSATPLRVLPTPPARCGFTNAA